MNNPTLAYWRRFAMVGLTCGLLGLFVLNVFSRSPGQNTLVHRSGDIEDWEMEAALEELGIRTQRYEYSNSRAHRVKFHAEHYIDGKLVNAGTRPVVQWDMKPGLQKIIIFIKNDGENMLNVTIADKSGKKGDLGTFAFAEGNYADLGLRGGLDVKAARPFIFIVQTRKGESPTLTLKTTPKAAEELKNKLKHLVLIYGTLDATP